MTDVRYFGYVFRRKAPGAIVTMEYRHPADFSRSHVARWMTDFCDIDPALLAPLGNAPQNRILEDVRFAVTCAIILYGEFLSRAAISCYHPGQVLRIEKLQGQADTYRLVLVLQILDNVPAGALKKVFDDAVTLLTRTFIHEPEPQTAETVLSQVFKNTIQALADHVPFHHTSETIMDLADRHNVPYRHLGLGVIRMGWGSNSVLVHNSETQFDSSIGLTICGNKQMTARALRSGGFPGAEHTLAESFEEAKRAARHYGWPVVVKPPNRERSEGVTANVTDELRLAVAFDAAKHHAPMVLIERQAPGFCYRVMVARGEIIYVVRRVPKHVIGDGTRSVEELVAAKNREQLTRAPWRREQPWPLDGKADDVLARQGHSKTSIPQHGERVFLRDITDGDVGGKPEDVTRLMHPDNARLAIDVTRYLGMEVCGVDIIIEDISRSWRETGCLINEINFRPQFKWRDREELSLKILATLIEGDGRIPVHAVTGEGDLMAAARSLRDSFAAHGQKCYLTSATRTVDHSGQELPMPFDTLFDRSIALTLRPDVDVLVMAGTSDQFIENGFPVDRFECVHLVGKRTDRAALLKLFKEHVEVRQARIV